MSEDVTSLVDLLVRERRPLRRSARQASHGIGDRCR